VGLIDQLFGSSTVVKTITTQHHLHSWNFLGLALTLLWALSPFGGQASLRVVGTGTKSAAQIPLKYLNMFLSNNDVFTFEAQESWTKANALFIASLLSGADAKNSSADSWGNVKIPMIDSLTSTPDESGWYSLLGDASLTYSSLVGVPISGLPLAGNTTSEIQTSYWALDCPTMEELQDGFQDANQTNYDWEGFYLSSITNRSSFWDTNNKIDPNAPPRRLSYRGTFIDQKGQKRFEYAECDITTTFVEVEVECSRTSCRANKMRTSKSPSILAVTSEIASFNDHVYDQPFQFPSSWTAFDGLTAWSPRGLIFGSFRKQFEQLSTSSNIIIGGTAVQHYFQDQINPFSFDVSKMGLIISLPRDSFATSLAQLINTMWLSIVGRNVISIGRTQSASDFLADPIYEVSNVLTSTGNRTESDVFICHPGWLAVLILATMTIFLAGVTGIILTALSKGPDLAMNMSTVLRESKNVNIPDGGTALDDDERGRLLKNTKVRIGDVAPRADVGRIGIGTIDSQGIRVLALSNTRYYE
jgi:hypothetical protein